MLFVRGRSVKINYLVTKYGLAARCFETDMNNSISKAKQIFDQIQQKKRLQKAQNIFKVINIDTKKNNIYVKQRFYIEHRL